MVHVEVFINEQDNGVFPEWIRNSVNSGNLINHWAQFKDSFCYLCLVCASAASWSLTQEVAGSNNLLKIQYFLSLNSAIQGKHLGKTQL